MSRESLVAALEEAGVPSEAADRERIRIFFEARGEILVPEVRDRMTRAIIAADADLLLPILLRHASPEAKAAALRGLLGERLKDFGGAVAMRHGYSMGYPVEIPVKPEYILNLLAPEGPNDGK